MRSACVLIFFSNNKTLFMSLFSKASILVCFMLLPVLSTARAATVNNPLQQIAFVKSTQGRFVNADNPAPGAQHVTVGLYGVNIYNFDLRSSTYAMTGYMWFRWKGDFDPVESLDFINLVQSYDFLKKTLLDKPILLSNGEKYQAIRFDGCFFQPFDLTSYPIDKQELSLCVENSSDTADKMCFVPDTVSTGYDTGLQVPGWNIIGLETKAYIHDYVTDFGEKGAENASKYSGIKFTLRLERYINYFIWKLMMPLLIILLTNWLSLLLHPTFFEVRTAMPATALLTVVFLQQSASDSIPGTSFLVLIDKIYLLAYLCIALTLLQIIVINAKYNKESFESIQRVIKIDKVSFVVQIMIFVVIFMVLVTQR